MYTTGQMFSLREILSKSESFFSDKIFEIVYDQSSNTNSARSQRTPTSRRNYASSDDEGMMKRFRYVQLKLNKSNKVNLVKDGNETADGGGNTGNVFLL